MLSRLTRFTDRLRHNALAIPAAVLMAALMVALNELAYRGAQSRLARLVEMGQARIMLMQNLQRTTEAESGKRGYMMTGGREYLDPYLQARSDMLANLKRLEDVYRRIGDDDVARHRTALDQAVHAKLGEMEEVVRLYDSGKPSLALDVVRSGIGRELMLKVRNETNDLVAQQNEGIRAGLTEVFDTLQLNRMGITAMTLVALLTLAMFVRLSRVVDAQRLQREHDIAAERDRLELEVKRRTAELTELARHLQTVREDERAHLARELHDELGALLTAAKLDVARIRPKLAQSAPDLVPRLTHLTESLNSGIALKRRIIEDLRPSTLSNLGLRPALEILCTEFQERSGVPLQMSLSPVRLPPSAELTVFRLVQEALTNIAKYAQARQVQVIVEAVGDDAEIRVIDDGSGFDDAQPAQGTHGLVGMRFRVEAERGQFSLHTAPGQGTTVLARLPQLPPTS